MAPTRPETKDPPITGDPFSSVNHKYAVFEILHPYNLSDCINHMEIFCLKILPQDKYKH